MNRTSPLRNLRRARTLNQADLARLVNISQQHLSKIERGRFVPSKDVAARLAAILGCSIQEIFPGAFPVTEPTQVREATPA